MRRNHRTVLWLLAAGGMIWVLAARSSATGPQIGNAVRIPAEPLDPAETPGPRPYEMVLAGQVPEPDPRVSFDALDGWMVEASGGAQGRWSVSVAQRVWDSPTGRLRYRGTSGESRLLLRPPSRCRSRWEPTP